MKKEEVIKRIKNKVIDNCHFKLEVIDIEIESEYIDDLDLIIKYRYTEKSLLGDRVKILENEFNFWIDDDKESYYKTKIFTDPEKWNSGFISLEGNFEEDYK